MLDRPRTRRGGRSARHVLRQRGAGCRYTDRAKHAIVLAQEQAKSHHHHYIGPEHILLGICGEAEGTGARIIEACGTDPGSLAADLTRRLLPPSGEVPDRPSFTAGALLGVLIQGSGPVAETLAEAGITGQRAERELLLLTDAGDLDETPPPGDRA